MQVQGCIIEEEEDEEDAPVKSAAAHTYDNYRTRWDRFDPDAATPAAAEVRQGVPAAPTAGTAAAASPAALPQGQRSAAAGRLPPPDTPSRPSLARTAKPGQPTTLPRTAAVPPPQRATAEGSPPQPTTAEGWKDRGNDFFKSGSYQAAVEAYSASVAASPTCLGYANRAMAALKLGDAAAAEADCTAALQLDGSYIKAYQRRSAARQLLHRLPEVCPKPAEI